MTITERLIDSILVALCILTLAFLGWWLLNEVGYTAENPRYGQCLTEDQPGYCIWKGQVRYFQDNTDIVNT